MSENNRLDLVKRGHEQFVLLANANPVIFRELVTGNSIIEIFSNSQYSNKAEIAPLIGEILSCLQQNEDGDDEEVGTSHNVRLITNVAKNGLVHLLKDQGIHLDVAASIGRLYSTNVSLLPSPQEWMKTTSKVVNLLSTSISVFMTSTFSSARVTANFCSSTSRSLM